MKKEFLFPILTPDKIDLYIVRTSILKALRETLIQFSGTILDVGCGYMPYKPIILAAPSRAEIYIGLDIADNNYMKPDLEWDGKTIPLANSSIDCAMATEVFEHCPDPEIVMKEIWRVLKPKGLLFFTVPFLWNLHNVPHDEYRFTPFSLERHFKNAGFEQIKTKALGGWNASLAQMIGLWVKRGLKYSIAQKALQAVLLPILLPLIWLLFKMDINPESFEEGQMITGLYGTAVK